MKGQEIKHELPFTAKNLEELYKQRPGIDSSSVSMVIMKVAHNGQRVGHVYSIQSYEQFRDKDFDTLWDYMRTPKFSLDRSARDNLENSHIK